jgi:hypothetical protein
MYISKLVILVLLLIVAVAKAQLISELISFYSDAACTNQTGYLYSFSGAAPGPSGCILSAYSNQYITYKYNVSEPVVEKFIGFRATIGGCPIYSDTIYDSSAALPGACITDPRSGNSSFWLECSADNTELTFYQSEGANCTMSLGQTVDAGSCSTFLFLTYGGWCEDGGALNKSPNASPACTLHISAITLIGTVVINLLI